MLVGGGEKATKDDAEEGEGEGEGEGEKGEGCESCFMTGRLRLFKYASSSTMSAEAKGESLQTASLATRLASIKRSVSIGLGRPSAAAASKRRARPAKRPRRTEARPYLPMAGVTRIVMA